MSLEVLLVVPDVREQRLLHLGHEERVLARAAVTERKIKADIIKFALSYGGCEISLSGSSQRFDITQP